MQEQLLNSQIDKLKKEIELQNLSYENTLMSKDYINGIITNIIQRKLHSQNVTLVKKSIFNELRDCIEEINDLVKQKRIFQLKMDSEKIVIVISEVENLQRKEVVDR